MAKIGSITFSNSGAASPDVFSADDSQLGQAQILNLVAQDPGSALLYSIGVDPALTNIVGNVSVPTSLIAQDSVGYQLTTSLGAKVTILDGGHVSYDASALADGLAAGQQTTDSFLYAIQMGHGSGTVAWNTVSVTLTGAAASISVHDNGVTEDLNVNGSGNLTDTVNVAALAASGHDTSFTVTGAATNLGTISPATGSGDANLTYSVSNAAVYATHLGFGESTTDSFTVTTANHTSQTFTETINGDIHAASLNASAAQASLNPGQSTLLHISATDHDDNAVLTYAITGVPADGVLSSAADPAGVSFNAQTGVYSVDAAALGDLTFTAGAAGQATLHVTVTNTETAGAATATATTSDDISLTVHSSAPAFDFTVGVPGEPNGAMSVYTGSNTNGDVIGDFGNYSHGFEYSHATGAYTTLDFGDPNSWGVPTGINNSGVIVGDFATAVSGYGQIPYILDGASQTYLGNGYYSVAAVSSDGVAAGTTALDPWIGSPDGNSYPFFFFSNGLIANVNHPGTAAAVGTNGDWMTGYSTNGANNYQGWVFTSSHSMNWVFENGSITNINAPDAAPGKTYSINFDGAGDVSGTYRDAANVAHGFVYSNGVYHEFDVPGTLLSSPGGGPSVDSGVTAVGPGGFAAGAYEGADGHMHGFLYNPNTNAVTTFDAPNGGDIREYDYSYWGSTRGTMAISPDGSEVAGMYTDAHGEHGFVFKDGAVTTLDVPGWEIVTPHAIDMHGDIIGEVSAGGPYDYGLGQVFIGSPI